MPTRPRIAHLSGQTATIQNTPPLVTSNKARAKYGLPPRTNHDGTQARFDVLRAQRLAAPVTLYVEQFSAHPLEADAAALYGPPDGYLDASGRFHPERQSPEDKPVYEVELRPEDGLYPLPYMARQAGGEAWEQEAAFPNAPAEQSRQGFFPDGSRSFEEIDRLHVGEEGVGNLISGLADVSFYRILPPGGYTRGLPAAQRTDVGEGDIPPERRGHDFFAYKPTHLRSAASRPALARAANAAQQILGNGDYDGAIWTEGSPSVEDMLYWLNLLVDTTRPICGNAAQRPHGMISNDGPKNIVDSVRYIASRVWADETGRDRAGAVLIAEQRVFAARAVEKGDARPGGYRATGGHGGILGAVRHDGPPLLQYLPTARHTHRSELNLTRLPSEVRGVRRGPGGIETIAVGVKDAAGLLIETAIPKVAVSKEVSYWSDERYGPDEADAHVEREVDLLAMLDLMLETAPLAGFVVEGLTPYGTMPSSARQRIMMRAVYSGFPVVRVGRGSTDGFATVVPPIVGGSNLTATKARLLLTAALLKLGALPPAANPDAPTESEVEATCERIAAFQELFDTH